MAVGDHIHQLGRFRAWNQHGRCDLEVKTAEAGVAHDVLHRFAVTHTFSHACSFVFCEIRNLHIGLDNGIDRRHVQAVLDYDPLNGARFAGIEFCGQHVAQA